MKKIINGPVFFPVLTVLLVSAFQPVFLYCRNADEADFSEIVPALLIFMAVGLLLLLFFGFLTQMPAVSAIIASLFILILTNYILIENVLKAVLPNLKYWHTVPIIITIGLHAAYLIRRFLNKETAPDVAKVICLVFGFLIVFNIVSSIPQIYNHLQAQRQLTLTPQTNNISHNETYADLPNVYLFIFDEYANFAQMEDVYNYDNAQLRDFLTEHSFNVSYNSHNESISSSTVQTNLVNLNYIVDDTTSESDKRVLRKNGMLFDLMREYGYNTQIFEATTFYGGALPGGTSSSTAGAGAKTINGETLFDILIQRTIFYPFHKIETAESISSILKIVDYLSIPENIPEDGTFTLVYFSFPHQPFSVDENGSPIPASQSTNWQDKQYYLGQFKFATKIMLQMLNNIINTDPDSVVFLQSDHSARGVGSPIEVMSNPLNAVYYRGQRDIGIQDLSLVNTVRVVLNNLLGTAFDIVEVPAIAR